MILQIDGLDQPGALSLCFEGAWAGVSSGVFRRTSCSAAGFRLLVWADLCALA